MITKPKIKLDPDRVKALAAEGKSQTKIAAMLGVSPDTLTRRKQEDPAIADALREGTPPQLKTLRALYMKWLYPGKTSPLLSTGLNAGALSGGMTART